MKRKHQKELFVSFAILFSFLFTIPNVAQQSQSSSPNSVASPTKNTSPATQTSPKQVNPSSKNASPTNSPSPPSNQQNPSSQKNSNVGDSIKDDWIKPNLVFAALVTGGFGLLAALLTGGFTIYQLHRNSKLQKELEQQRQNFQKELELEKIRLQQQLTLEVQREKLELEKQKAEEQETKKLEEELKEKEEIERMIADYAEQYRQKIITEMCNLSICNLPYVPSSLSLDSIYVELSVREEELLHYLNSSEINSLTEGNPNKLLKRSQSYLTEKSTDVISPVEALVKFSQMIVLGNPGAGKTTMLCFLALKMAKLQENRLSYLPLYVELAKFVQSDTKDLLEFIATECDIFYEFPKAIDYLTEQLNKGKAALLCDGLDEVLGGESQEKAQVAYNLAVDEINRLKIRFPKAPIVVTCRKAGWSRGLTGFKTLEVLDFSWEQIQYFVHNWFKSNPGKENGIKQALAGNLRMQTLAANPLILSLITIVYQQDLELPERRAELYKRCLDLLLREWDSSRQIKRYSEFTIDRKLDLLKEVAWHFHNQGKRYFEEKELLPMIADFLTAINIEPGNDQAILQEIAAQYGLLKEQAIGYYGFLHLTFQEYLTALAANDCIQESLPNLISDRRDPWCTEVILLLSGIMADATPLILGILGHSIDTQLLPEGKLAIKDDLFHSDLFLAARCLVGIPIIRLQGLREKIIDEVKDLLLNSRYELDWRNSANTLMEIGGQDLEYHLFTILEDSNQDKWKGQAIANALGKWGNTQTAKNLLEIIKSDTKLDISVFRAIIINIVELKATFAAYDFLEMLKIKEKSHLCNYIAQALGSLGSQTIIPELRKIFYNLEWYSFSTKEEVFQMIIKLADKKQVSEFLSGLPN